MQTASEFGRELIRTQDLDPVYVAIHGAGLNFDTKAKLCVAYWCLYHLGAAAKIAESKDYWGSLGAAAYNKPNAWPRGSERRHWRGQAAIDSYQALLLTSPTPQGIVRFWAEPGTFKGVSERVRAVRGFGPWIAFKVADMIERCFGLPVDFTDCSLAFYDEPRKGAALYWRGDEEAQVSPVEVAHAAERLRRELGNRSTWIPPDYTRRVAVQELETIFCKWKSYRHGRYWVGKDIKEIRHALHGWGDLAQQLLTSMPKEVSRPRTPKEGGS